MVLLLLTLACSAPAPEAQVDVAGPARTRARSDPARDAVAILPAVRDRRWAHARCNDGTPFGLTLRDAGSDTWVIKVAGGFFCDDEITPCSERPPRLTSTPRHGGAPVTDRGPSSLDPVGLFSRDATVNPDFAGANHVELHYCSSDLWLGDRTERQPTSGHPDGWWFSGRHNLAAGLEVLVRDHGLDDAAHKVLIVGHSAGGMGVIGSFDAIRGALPTASADGRLKVVLDGAWVPDQPELGATPRANRWGPLHPRCIADREAEGADPLLCVFGPVWYPYLRDTGVPVLVQQSAADVTQLRVYGVKGRGTAAWRQRARASLSGVDWLYSGGARYHVLTFEPGFAAGPPGRTFRDLLSAFVADQPPQRVLIDDREPR